MEYICTTSCCFHMLAIISNAAVNTGVHISFQIIVLVFFFSGCIPWSGNHWVIWTPRPLHLDSTVLPPPCLFPGSLISLLCVCVTSTPRHDPSKSWHFTLNKDILLYDHSTILTLRKFSIDKHCWMQCPPYSNIQLSQSCPLWLVEGEARLSRI